MATKFDLQFDVHGPLEDGTLIAACRQLPMIVAATSEQELRHRVMNSVDQLTKFLEGMGTGGDVDYLREAGVTLRNGATKGSEEKRTMTFPVLVGAATR